MVTGEFNPHLETAGSTVSDIIAGITDAVGGFDRPAASESVQGGDYRRRRSRQVQLRAKVNTKHTPVSLYA